MGNDAAAFADARDCAGLGDSEDGSAFVDARAFCLNKCS